MTHSYIAILLALVSFTTSPAFSSPPTTDIDISKTPSAPPAAMTRSEFTHEGLTKPYSIFSPPKTQSSPGARPLLVLLHGCLQDAEAFAKSTRMNELAIRENAFVLYPEQTATANQMRCWNWFDPANQARSPNAAASPSPNPSPSPSASSPSASASASASERAWLAALITTVAETVKADPKKVYIAGLSAGAAMTVNMLSCHPELFAAGGVAAGLPFAAASDAVQGAKAMQSGTSVKPKESAEKAFACSGGTTGAPMSVFVVQGDADKVVVKSNGPAILKHFEALNDLRDDGKANGSFIFKTVSNKGNRARKKIYAHTLEIYKGNGASARVLKVKKLGHAWSGGAADVEYSDPKGPSASDAMWEFFSGLNSGL